MTRVPVHTVANAPAAARETLGALQQKTGKVLNIHGAMAHAPVVLAAYAGIQQAIAEQGSFDVRTREAIALAVAAADRCDYCQAAHTGAATKAGWTTQETIAIRSALPVDARTDALLDVVREATTSVGEVDGLTWKSAVAAGWTETELAEAFAHLAVNLFTNYFNHYVATGLDLPPAPALTD